MVMTRYGMRSVPLKLFLMPYSVIPTCPHTDSSCNPCIYAEQVNSWRVPASLLPEDGWLLLAHQPVDFRTLSLTQSFPIGFILLYNDLLMRGSF